LGIRFTTTYTLNNNILLDYLYDKYIKSPHGKKRYLYYRYLDLSSGSSSANSSSPSSKLITTHIYPKITFIHTMITTTESNSNGISGTDQNQFIKYKVFKLNTRAQ
jgi:hypothetical protein